MAKGKFVEAVTVTEVKVVEPEKFVFEFSRKEAELLRKLVGNISGGLSYTGKDHPRLVTDAMWDEFTSVLGRDYKECGEWALNHDVSFVKKDY